MIWGRPVHLQARVEDDTLLFTCDEPGPETPIKKDKVNSSTPAPAHVIE